jgi:hypothetical protein
VRLPDVVIVVVVAPGLVGVTAVSVCAATGTARAIAVSSSMGGAALTIPLSRADWRDSTTRRGKCEGRVGSKALVRDALLQ